MLEPKSNNQCDEQCQHDNDAAYEHLESHDLQGAFVRCPEVTRTDAPEGVIKEEVKEENADDEAQAEGGGNVNPSQNEPVTEHGEVGGSNKGSEESSGKWKPPTTVGICLREPEGGET